MPGQIQTRDGVLQAQLGGVQHDARRGSGTVKIVTHDRVADFCHVYAQLMRATSNRFEFDTAFLLRLVPCQHAPTRMRWPSRLPHRR